MTVRTVLKEMRRTPGRTVLFLLLLALSTALLVLGLNLYASCRLAWGQVSQNYRTVGTIKQKPDGVRELGEEEPFYSQDQLDVYSVHIPEDAFDSLPTKLPVENRPCVVTTGEIYSGILDGGSMAFDFPFRAMPPYVITFMVDEVMDSTDPAFLERHASVTAKFDAKMNVLTVNGEAMTDEIYTGCGLHWPFNNGDVYLEPGKEYIAYASRGYSGSPGFILYGMAKPTDIGKNKMEYREFDQVVYEYTPEFMGTEEGEYFQYLIDAGQTIQEISQQVCITVPTQSLALLDPFYRGDVTIKYGREITQEEFDTGAKVCMIPEEFRGNEEHLNLVDVGDKIRLDFRGAAYNYAPGTLSGDPGFMNVPLSNTTLDIEGSEEYEVVGIYYTAAAGMDYRTGLGGMNLGSLEIIVPSKSYDFDSLSILAGGPLDPACVSFELENGTASDFLLAVEGLEYGGLLQVTINDQGYNAIAKGLDAISLLAWILLLSGGASALCLLLFFVYLQIARRQREAAIQLSLGAGRGRCAVSLLLGAMLVALVGIGAGAMLGHLVTGQVSHQVYSQAKESGYSREYSDQMEASLDKAFDYEGSAAWPITLGAGLGALGTALALSAGFTAHALSKEPLEQLTRKE